MFLLLTDVEDESVLIEAEAIIAAVRDKDAKKRPYTAIWFGPEFHIRVQETPDEIFDMVDEASGTYEDPSGDGESLEEEDNAGPTDCGSRDGGIP